MRQDNSIFTFFPCPGRHRSVRRRASAHLTQQQCAARPYLFVVHGLWPQDERGFPEFCQVPAPKLDRNIVGSMLDIMPAPRLIFQQWEKHGTCSGLNSNAYFETVRKVRAIFEIPAEFMQLTEMLTVRPDEVEEAFVKANPGLSRDAVAVTCDSRRLSEVRVSSAGTFTFTAVPTSMSMPAGVRRWSCRPCAKGPPPWHAKHAAQAPPSGLPRGQTNLQQDASGALP